MKITGTYYLDDDTPVIVTFDYRPEQTAKYYPYPGEPPEADEVDDLECTWEDGRQCDGADLKGEWDKIYSWAYSYGSENWQDFVDYRDAE